MGANLTARFDVLLRSPKSSFETLLIVSSEKSNVAIHLPACYITLLSLILAVTINESSRLITWTGGKLIVSTQISSEHDQANPIAVVMALKTLEVG